MYVSARFDRGDLSRITNQLFDEDLFTEDEADEAGKWLVEWNRYLSDFYDQDDSVYLATV